MFMPMAVIPKNVKQVKKDPPKPRDGWQAAYQDPLRWKLPQSNEELCISGTPRVDTSENDLCTCKVLVMHTPTHEPKRMTSGEYPFCGHLHDKKRNWEIRLQLRFKKVPERLYFGVELAKFVAVSGTARAVQKALVSACKKIVGDCYHSNGDDPAAVSGECELPTFVMPLWAFDQFEVAEPGKEPDLCGDFDKVGMKRTDGAREYVKAMTETIANFSTEKVYTFSFWGVSQFLDCIRWKISGSVFPMEIDFNKLCGKPPMYITMYELAGAHEKDRDKRHLPSRKSQYLSVACWSGARPASLGGSAPEPVAAQADIDLKEEDILKITAKVEELPDLMNMDDFFGETSTPAKADSFDLLDLDFGGSSGGATTNGYVQNSAAPQAPAPAAAAKPAESTDLLGLF